MSTLTMTDLFTVLKGYCHEIFMYVFCVIQPTPVGIALLLLKFRFRFDFFDFRVSA
jgi:hypothetical protein